MQPACGLKGVLHVAAGVGLSSRPVRVRGLGSVSFHIIGVVSAQIIIAVVRVNVLTSERLRRSDVSSDVERVHANGT